MISAATGAMAAIDTITGLVLAGGLGTRMGGVDKGLQEWQGVALARHAMTRLRPQVGLLAVSANRNLDVYARLAADHGAPVWPDAPEHARAGPLAGLLAGLTRATTPLLAVVPCDVPQVPADLVARLAAALDAADAEIAHVCTPADGRVHPTCCLLRRTLRDDLAAHLQAGGRKVLAWMQRRRCVEVRFDDAAAFANVNTLADLRRHGDAG